MLRLNEFFSGNGIKVKYLENLRQLKIQSLSADQTTLNLSCNFHTKMSNVYLNPNILATQVKKGLIHKF